MTPVEVRVCRASFQLDVETAHACALEVEVGNACIFPELHDGPLCKHFIPKSTPKYKK